MLASCGNNRSNDNTSTFASLEQNVLNSYHQNTVIQCTLPANYKSARMSITNNFGKEIKSAPLSDIGKLKVSFDTTNLFSGTYQFINYRR